jgi:hypothetical protein
MANRLTVRDNILVVAAAGNRSMDDKIHVELLGNAKYAMSVTGVNRHGRIASFASQGPVSPQGGYDYLKPDLATVAGGANPGESSSDASAFVVGPRSSATACQGRECYGEGSTGPYTFMRGTSQAAPMAAGAAADVIGYLKNHGVYYRATEVKALLMETAQRLAESPEKQGAGLLNGESLAATTQERVRACTSVGNVAFMLSRRLTSEQRYQLSRQQRFKTTPLGILDSKTGDLIKTDRELVEMLKAVPGIRSEPQTVSLPQHPKPHKFTHSPSY